MSIRDINKTIIVTDALTGEIITTIDKTLYDIITLKIMVSTLFENDYENEHGLLIKYGYKN